MNVRDVLAKQIQEAHSWIQNSLIQFLRSIDTIHMIPLRRISNIPYGIVVKATKKNLIHGGYDYGLAKPV